MTSNGGIAILGAGLFAKEAHLPALATLGTAAPALKAVYSRSERSAQELASSAATALKLDSAPSVYYDGDTSKNLDALLKRSDITAVIVVLPITHQPGVILKALAAGKHVLSEKPIAPDVAEGARLIATFKSQYKPKGLVWRVAENFEAEPGCQAAGKAIRDGKIGKVLFFNTQVLNYIDKESKWYKTPWRTVPDYQGGFLLDGGVHSAASLRVLLPSPLTHLSGFASLNKDYLKPHDTINCVLKAADGSHGIFELTFAAPCESLGKEANGMIVTGSSGWLSVKPAVVQDANTGSQTYVMQTTIKSVTEVDGKPGPEKEEVINEPMRGVVVELKSFFTAMNGSDDGLGDPAEALKDVALIQAALNSEGQLVDLVKLVSQQ
jgi:predicted dehydrogenase